MFEAVENLSEYDEGFIGGLGAIGGLAYAPDLAPVGSGSAGTYYPRDTSGDAAALNYLGFFPDNYLALHVGTRGSQKADASVGVGAWSPLFQAAVRDFQEAEGLSQDGWIGPNTRKRLGERVAAKNASGGLVIPNNTGPSPLPVIPTPSGPGPVPAKSGGADHTMLYAAGGVLALLGLGYYLTR